MTDLVILVGIPAQHDDGNPVFEANRVYNIRVSAMAYGKSTNDTEIRALALVEPNTNTTMTVEGETEAVSVDAHTRYRVRIECEGADTFEFFNGEEWEEVHHGDDMNDEEREQIGGGDGACEFYAWTGDSGTYALLPDETYTVDVSVGKECWDGNSTTLTFNVVAPEDDGLRLIVPNADDVWVNDPVQASLYAPGASRCWIEGDGVFESGKGEYTSGTEYAIIDIDSNRVARQPGIAKLTGYAEYTDGETKQTDTVEIEVKSLGRVGLPIINATEALTPDDEALTFSIGYSDLPEIPEDWEDFDFQNGYSWYVSMLDGDGDFHGDWETIVDWTDMQRGEGDTSEEITIGADQGFEWREGAIYRIGVNTWANRCEGNGTELSLICVSAYDENVTLEVVPDSGRDLDQLLHNESLKLVINAPRDSDRFELFTGYQWEDFYPNYDENAEAFIWDRRFGEGIYNLAVRARYADEEGGEMVMHAPSRPVQITVNCLGKLDAPEVRLAQAEVNRGEFMDVNISDVENADTEHYRCEFHRWDDNSQQWNWYKTYDWDLTVGDNMVTTAALEPGSYGIVAYATNVGWQDSNPSEPVEFTVSDNTADENGFVLRVSADKVLTGENFTATAYTTQGIPGWDISLWVEDVYGNEDYGFDQRSEQTYRGATFNLGNAGTYKVCAIAREYEDGEMLEKYAEPVYVEAEAPYGTLKLPVVDAPASVKQINPDDYGNAYQFEDFEVQVYVNDAPEEVESFRVSVTTQWDNNTLFESDDIFIGDTDGPIVTVPVHIDTQGHQAIGANQVLCVNTYASAVGYEDDPGNHITIRTAKPGEAQGPIVTLAEGEDPDELWASQDFRLAIDPNGAKRLKIVDDFGSQTNLNTNETETNWRMGSGTHLVWLLGFYPEDPDEPYGEGEWVDGEPIRVRINTYGMLDAPEVEVVEKSVAKGEFLTVNLGEVMVGGEPADGYTLQVWYMDEWDNWQQSYERDAVSGENRIPTAVLRPGECYVTASAHKARWDDNWSGRTEASSFTVEERQEEGLTLALSTETAMTGEQWWISGIYTGDLGGCYLNASVLDENGGYYDCVPGSDGYYEDENGANLRQAYAMKHAGTYTVKVWLEDEDGETRIYEETATVVVTAPNGDLEIGFGEMPTEFDGLQVLEVPVTVNNGVERFDLKMTKLHQGEILTVFEQTDIPTTNKVDGTVVTVEVPLQGIDLVNDRYTLEVNTWQAGWNEASASVVIGGGDSEALDDPEIGDMMPSVIKGHNINIEVLDADERATRTYATIVAEDVTYPQYELETDGWITIPTNDLQPGIYQINICSEAEGYNSSATTVSVRVLDVDAWLTLPLGMKTIGEEAFAGTGAEIIEIPEGATSIGSKAFANSKAGYVYIPDSVTEIADDAFEGCEDLVIECLYGSYAETYCEENGIYCNGYGE